MVDFMLKWLAAQFEGPPSSRLNAVMIIVFAVCGYALIGGVRSSTDLHTQQITGVIARQETNAQEAEKRYLDILATFAGIRSSIESIRTDIHWLARERQVEPGHPAPDRHQ